MATLAQNVKRGNAAMKAARLDPTDAGTQTSDAIVNVLHAGFASAQHEVLYGVASPNVDEDGPKFVPGETSAECWFDDVVAHARANFLAEQAGDDS